MRFSASVTFESNTTAPKSHRCEIEAGSPQSAASRAIRLARREHKGVRWSSVVVVIEKIESAAKYRDLVTRVVSREQTRLRVSRYRAARKPATGNAAVTVV
jgi:hypothetical protein